MQLKGTGSQMSHTIIVMLFFEDKLKFIILFYGVNGVKKGIYKHVWININNEVIKKKFKSSHNVSHDEVMPIEDLKAKNAREWKHALEKRK